MHLSEWLIFALAGWLVISLASLPFVGLLLAGTLSERANNPPRRGRRPVADLPKRTVQNSGVPAPSA